MSDDLYNELLGALSESTPPVAKVGVYNHGGHRFTITHHEKLRDMYTADDVAGLMGFVMSVMVSGAINTSTTLVAMYHNPEFLQDKLKEYIKQSQDIDHEVTDGAQELSNNLIVSMTESAKTVMDAYIAEGKATLRDPVDLPHAAATLCAAFLLGRFAAVNVHEATPEQSEGFTVSLTAMLRELYSTTQLVEESLLEDLQAMFRSMFEDNELFRGVETGEINPTNLKEAMQRHVGKIPGPKGLG